MATLEVIRQIITRARTEGVDKATSDLRKLGEAHADIAVVSEKSAKATLSAEAALKKQERALDTNYRSADQFRKTLTDLDRARAQGIVSQTRYAELVDLAAKRATQGAQVTGMYAAAQSAASSQAQMLAARLGPIGGLIAGVGTAGLVTAGAMGGLALGYYKASEAADAFATDMLKVRDITETLKLSVTAFQAIGDVGAMFGLSEEKVGSVLQRFTAQMEEFRRGQGDLFALVQRIDPTLAREMAQVRDTAGAIDMLARVYEKAGDARQKLDRAIGGKNGGTVGLLFQELGRQGGTASVTAEFEKSGDAIDKNMIEKIARLKAEIDDMSGDAQRNLASIFSVQLLENEARFVSGWREITRGAKEFSLSPSLEAFIKFFKTGFNGLQSDEQRQIMRSGDEGKIRAELASLNARRGNLQSAMADPNDPANLDPGHLRDIQDELTKIEAQIKAIELAGKDIKITVNANTGAAADVPFPQSRPSQAIDRSTQEFDLNMEKARIGALGSAATATERLAQRKRELDLAIRDNVISQSDYNRALGAAGLETAMQLESRRLGLLGELARVDDIVAQKQREINLARAQGVRITQEESAAILERTRLQAEYSKLPNRLQFERDQIGRNDIDATVAARLRSEGLPINLDSATAAEMRFNETLRQTKDLLVETGTGALRTFRSELDQTGNAWNALGRTALKVLDNIIMKAADKGLERGITNLMGGFGGGTGAAAGRGGLLGGFIIPGILHDGGLGANAPSSGRLIHPAYFDDAPRFHNGKLPFGPNEMPAIIDKREEVDYPANLARKYGGGGGSVTVVMNDNRTFNDTTPQVVSLIQARDKAEWPKKKAEIVNELKKRRAGDPNLYSPG